MAFVLPSVLEARTLDAVGYGLALSIVALSLVPLTGFAGQINLAPLAFAGIGAVVMYHWGSDGNPLALVAVVLIAAWLYNAVTDRLAPPEATPAGRPETASAIASRAAILERVQRVNKQVLVQHYNACLLYTSPSPRDS